MFKPIIVILWNIIKSQYAPEKGQTSDFDDDWLNYPKYKGCLLSYSCQLNDKDWEKSLYQMYNKWTRTVILECSLHWSSKANWQKYAEAGPMLVAQEVPTLTFFYGYTKCTPTYRAISPEEQLRVDWTASAQKAREAPYRKG